MSPARHSKPVYVGHLAFASMAAQLRAGIAATFQPSNACGSMWSRISTNIHRRNAASRKDNL